MVTLTFQAFLEKYNGKYVEVAGPTAVNQCTDLANAYIREVLNLPIIEWTNAVDFPSKANGNYDFIKNEATNAPQEGDLVIWGGNQYGHIAIATGDNTGSTSFRSFDQNFPTGSPAHIQNHTYANVLGWMRAHKQPQQEVNTNVQKNVQFDRITTFLHSISILPTDRSEDYINDDGLLNGVKNLDTENKRKAEEIDKLKQDIESAHIEAGELKSELSDRQNAINTLNLKISDLNQAMEADAVEDHDMGIKILDYEKQITELNNKISELEAAKNVDVEPVIKHYDNILEHIWPNIYKSKKAQSLREKFWKWIR